MKPMYQHHHDKAIVPLYIDLYMIGDSMDEDTYEAVRGLGFNGVDVSITVSRVAEDKECGIPMHYELEDVDVAPTSADLLLFRDIIVRACEDYVYTYEEDVLSSEKVNDAFFWLDCERKKFRAA